MTESLYGPSEASGLWIVLEVDGGSLVGVSRELLGRGRELADAAGETLTGLILGHDLDHAAVEALAWGADRVLLADDPRLDPYTTDAHAAMVAGVVAERRPDIMLFGATPNGRDLAGRLAVRLRTGLTADCTGLALEPDTGLLLGEVVGFGGGIVATIKCERHRPQMATVRPGVFQARAVAAMPSGAGADARIERVPVLLSHGDLRTQVVERHVGAAADITQAERIVVVGGGTGGNLGPARELADALGAEIGATRVAVDAGWVEPTRMIGQTGSAVRPRLAVLCGVSGAMQFTVGIQEADTVIAVNSDPDAPVFDDADFGIVGDVQEAIPRLVAAVREIDAGREGRR